MCKTILQAQPTLRLWVWTEFHLKRYHWAYCPN